MRWNLNVSSPRTMVWPALFPPWKRATTSARSARRSTTLPLPSSPHCAPTTTVSGIGLHLLLDAAGQVVELGVAPDVREPDLVDRPVSVLGEDELAVPLSSLESS